MGHISVTATVAARRRARVRFLVDTGSTYSIIPPALAGKIDAPTLPRTFEVTLADGRTRRVRACSLAFSVAGRTGPTIALVLPRSEPLLGAETLEVLGLKVNPAKRRLEPSRAHAALLVGGRPRFRDSA